MLHKSSSASFSSFLIWRKWDRGRFESGEGGSSRQFSNNQLNISKNICGNFQNNQLNISNTTAASAAPAGNDNLTILDIGQIF